MVHGSDELQEDHRTAAFQAVGQLDPRQPSIAGALAAQVRRYPIRRVKRTYPRDNASHRGPQRHRPVAHPAWQPPLRSARPGPGGETATPGAGRECVEDQARRHRTCAPLRDAPDLGGRHPRRWLQPATSVRTRTADLSSDDKHRWAECWDTDTGMRRVPRSAEVVSPRGAPGASTPFARAFTDSRVSVSTSAVRDAWTP